MIDDCKDDISEKILKLKAEKNAVILAHYYVTADLQMVADFVGDSLQLSQEAAQTKADIIVFVGVNFMAETAKILSPNKKVLLPDVEAGCSLSDSCPTKEFTEFINNYPEHTVISYINTTAEIKALSDIIVTSSNAKNIIEKLPSDAKIIFGPDKNLGAYINSITGREMILWNGACHVHKRFDLEKILLIKKENPDAKIIAHPECEKPILLVSDFVGSTAAMLKFTQTSDYQKFIVVTETGILFKMRQDSPKKIFIPAPPTDEDCSCNDCSYMKLNTLEKLYDCLVNETPEIILPEKLMRQARSALNRMMTM
jgi:quinolinate synthase